MNAEKKFAVKPCSLISLLDRSLQEEIKKGTIRPVKAEDLMVSAISLNIFVFVANPLIQLFVEEKGEEYHQYMERRKQENVEIILSRLKGYSFSQPFFSASVPFV